ncbi:unnamed protein product, partial [marine sediment metagenome]
ASKYTNAALSNNDILIVLSGSGTTSIVVSLLKNYVNTAKPFGIISITSHPETIIGRVGDITIKLKGRTKRDKLFREFTAAALGKIDKSFDLNSVKKEDIISSLIGVIGENIGTIATLMAENHEVKHIIFCGGFLIENKTLKQILSLLCKFKRIKPIFIENSVFAGAIGALLFNST